MRLNATVIVTDSQLRTHVLGPDDEIPDWAASQITNPHVIIPEDDDDRGAPVPTNPPATNPPAENPPATNPPAENPPATNPPAENPPATNPPAENPPAEDPPALTPPPRSGNGSGAKPWAEYALAATAAAGMNIEIPADATRADIIEALTEAGIRTE